MKIVWTEFAIQNLKDIFDYYATKAGKKVAHKIRKQILESSKQLKNNPSSGPMELHLISVKRNYRSLICGNHKLIYRIVDHQIIINDVFDTRQNPSKMNDEKRITV